MSKKNAMQAMDYAVIDLGSNTVRLCVYRCEGERFTTVLRQKEVVGLAGYVQKNRIQEEGIEKACEILRDFKEIAIRFVKESDMYAFATASLRGMRNQAQAVERIRQASGLLIEVLPGEEEARLDFVGASYFAECSDGMLIDIGGASTELVRFRDGQIEKLISLPMGCLSLYTRFVGKIIPAGKERKQIKKEIRAQLKQCAAWQTKEKLPLMIGVGGTARAVQKLSGELYVLPKAQGTIDAECIGDILQKLNKNEDEIYRTVYKLIPERALTIITGLMILSEVIAYFGCECLCVSEYGVREGYLIDRVMANFNSV